MQVIVNSDHSITGDASQIQRTEAVVFDAVGHYAERITKVDAFFSDANSSSKHGARDKHCVLEAHIPGSQPAVAKGEAPSVLEALDSAAAKLSHALEHAFGKHAAAAGKTPRERDVATVDELNELEKWERDRRAHESKHAK